MNKKSGIVIIILIITILTASCSNKVGVTEQDKSKHIVNNTSTFINPEWGINPDKLPTTVTEDTFPKFQLGSLQKIFGFSGKDLQSKDFSKLSLSFLSDYAFDNNTKWPPKDNLPKDFFPSKWFEIGKDPGLQLSQIHTKGYTGKGISVAIIDKPILSNHQELGGNIIYTPIGQDTKLHFHGLACASILVGKTCGVVPQSKLYYFAVPDNGHNFDYYIMAINEILKINSKLPVNERIRIVSISDGLTENDKIWSKWNEAFQKATNEGIIVLYSNNVSKNFTWGGCPPFKDRNNPSNYSIANKAINKIILPADFRTTASNDNQNSYIYWGEAGFSWGIPYLAGICALGLQVDPNLSFEEMKDFIINTKSINTEGYSIINPIGFIESVKFNKQNKRK